jgi:hypothetical protein
METAVTRLNGNESTPTPQDAKYQYQRAYALSMSLKDHLYGYSIEQLRQLQAHNVLVYVKTFICELTSLTSS